MWQPCFTAIPVDSVLLLSIDVVQVLLVLLTPDLRLIDLTDHLTGDREHAIQAQGSFAEQVQRLACS